MDVEIVSIKDVPPSPSPLSPNALEPNHVGEERFQEWRPFSTPLPSVLRVSTSLPTSDGSAAETVVVNGNLVADYADASAECRENGPLVFVVRGSGERWRWASVPLLFVATAVIAIGTTLLASLYRGSSVFWGTSNAMAVVLQFFVTFSMGFYIMAVVSVAFPSVTRSTLALLICFIPEVVLVVLDIGYNVERVKSGGWIFWAMWVGMVPLIFILPFHVARAHLRHITKKSPGAPPPEHSLYYLRGLLAPSGVVHALSVLMIVGMSLIVVLRATTGNIVVVPVLVLLLLVVVAVWWSLWVGVSWSTGHAVAVPLLMDATYFLVVLLQTFLDVPIGIGNPIVTAIKFLLWYVFYGALFSLTQVMISLATTSYLAPQWLLLSQLSLETYMGIAFVKLKTDAEFWVTLVLQSCWALFQNSGLKADVWWRLRDWVIELATRRRPAHGVREIVARENFFFLLNTQGMITDVLATIFLPIIISIDSVTSWGCTISCEVTPAVLSVLVSRYAIVLLFRVIAGTIAMASYCYRFTRLTCGRSSWKNVLRSMIVSTQLHFLRHLVLFIAVVIFMFTELFPALPVPLLSGSSVSSFSSL